MHTKKILLFALVLGGLYAAARVFGGDTAGGPPDYRVAVFPDLAVDRVASIRVDNVERSLVVEMERDSTGRWSITDPLAYPAHTGIVSQILKLAPELRGPEVPDPDLEQLSLEPPLVELELTERAEGFERRSRVAVGGKDLDGRRVHVLVDGKVLRVPLSLYTALDRNVNDFRERRILPARLSQAIEVARRGVFAVVPGGEPVDARLVARREEGRWMLVEPYRALLSGAGAGTVLAALGRLDAQRFVRDDANAVSDFGLDQPAFEVELDLPHGERLRVAFGSDPRSNDLPHKDRVWLCAVEGRPHVYEVEYANLLVLAAQPTALLEYSLLNMIHEGVARVEVQTLQGGVTAERSGNVWKLTGLGEDSLAGREVLGSDQKVGDLITLIDRVQIATFLPERRLADDEVVATVRVVDKDGGVQAGRFGGTIELNPGVTGILYQRDGDEICAALPDRAADILAASVSSLRRDTVLKVEELGVTRIAITGPGGEELERIRNGENGLWFPEGVELEDKRFAPLVDRLLSIRAAEWLFEPLELEGRVEVRVRDKLGKVTHYAVGTAERDGESLEVVEHEGEQAAVRPGLHGDLLELL